MFGMVPYRRRNNGISRRDDIYSLEDFFNEFFNDVGFPSFFRGANPIRADIRENENEYVIDAELPGVRKEDIKIDLRDDVLTIAVEHNEQINEEKENFIRRERRYGSYSRSFYVENVKNEEVTAKYVDGVLTITLPKQKTGRNKGHRIEIQ